jgi:hypothetical protein
MKYIVIIFWLLVGAGCIAVAAYLKYKMMGDWGWFLLAGLAILSSLALKDRVTINEDEEDDEC